MRSQVRKVAMFGALALGFGAMLNSAAQAAIVFADPFTYPNGPLIGQGGWTITGTSVVNPIQVSSNAVPLTTTGQDAFAPLNSSVPHTDGNSIFTCFNLTVSAAQTTGDYFVHLSDPAGTTSNFYERIHARSSGGGFQLGLAETSGATPAVTYGAGVLNLNQSYFVVVAWNFVAGAINDTFSMYVDPTNPVEALNPAYLGLTWTSAAAEPAQIAAVNFRQGTAGNAATVTVDNLNVSTLFADQIPEPASLATVALAGLALAARRRRT
jgi:trimeric autotransporter adhesin